MTRRQRQLAARAQASGVSVAELEADHRRRAERAVRLLELRIDRRGGWDSIAGWAARHGRTWAVQS